MCANFQGKYSISLRTTKILTSFPPFLDASSVLDPPLESPSRLWLSGNTNVSSSSLSLSSNPEQHKTCTNTTTKRTLHIFHELCAQFTVTVLARKHLKSEMLTAWRPLKLRRSYVNTCYLGHRYRTGDRLPEATAVCLFGCSGKSKVEELGYCVEEFAGSR